VSRCTFGGTLLALLLVSGCVPASPDADTYRDKTAVTLGAAVSDVATVERLLQMSYDGRMLRATALTQLRYSDGALGTATDAYTELNPPPRLDGLYERSSTLLGDAGDLVAEARIAIERREVDRYPDLADELKKIGSQLEKLEGRVS
jgi:hypothetical protein